MTRRSYRPSFVLNVVGKLGGIEPTGDLLDRHGLTRHRTSVNRWLLRGQFAPDVQVELMRLTHEGKLPQLRLDDFFRLPDNAEAA